MVQLTPSESEEIGELILGPHLGLSLGPFILGFLVDAVLLGVVIQQFVMWHTYSASSERRWVRFLVYYLFLASFVTSGYLLAYIMHLFVYNFGTFGHFLDTNWSSVFYLLDLFARLPVSAFFGERAWRLMGRSWLVGGSITLLLLVSAGGAIGAKVQAVNDQFGNTETYLVYTWLGSEMASDVLTTGCITWCLLRSKSSFDSTNRIINKLLVPAGSAIPRGRTADIVTGSLTAETQLPPTIMAVAYLIFYVMVHQSTKFETFAAFFTCTPKIYVVCLLTVLSARLKLREERSNTWKADTYRMRSRKEATQQMTIDVTTETYTHIEGHGVRGRDHSHVLPTLPRTIKHPDSPEAPSTVDIAHARDGNSSAVHLV
ncbi:hypothetical protein JCM24511_00688 [Saitozyma sp. JCM 24511]|nr:hypothetical protein JCM24511_00688 [Saitozyma sp. JCM 24511]